MSAEDTAVVTADDVVGVNNFLIDLGSGLVAEEQTVNSNHADEHLHEDPPVNQVISTGLHLFLIACNVLERGH